MFTSNYNLYLVDNLHLLLGLVCLMHAQADTGGVQGTIVRLGWVKLIIIVLCECYLLEYPWNEGLKPPHPNPSNYAKILTCILFHIQFFII